MGVCVREREKKERKKESNKIRSKQESHVGEKGNDSFTMNTNRDEGCMKRQSDMENRISTSSKSKVEWS